MQAFWKHITKEMREIDYQTEEFRTQTELPIRPIRRVMCQEGEVGVNKVMFTAESSVLFAKASSSVRLVIINNQHNSLIHAVFKRSVANSDLF
jgi:hypothetical protein